MTITPPESPDCIVGKHDACSGDAWNKVLDRGAPCSCGCHTTDPLPFEDDVAPALALVPDPSAGQLGGVVGAGPRPVPAGASTPAELPDPTVDVEAWLRYGIARGFCTRDECLVHGWFPLTEAEEEEAEDEDGEPPCFHGVRLLSDDVREELRYIAPPRLT